MSAFSPRSAAFVAFSCGSLSSVLVRPGRSGAAWVLVAGFESLSSASAFARRAAIRAGRSVALRPGAGGAAGAWSVSCPVAWPSSRGPAGAGRLLPVVGRGARSVRRPGPRGSAAVALLGGAVCALPPSSAAPRARPRRRLARPCPWCGARRFARWFAPCPLCGSSAWCWPCLARRGRSSGAPGAVSPLPLPPAPAGRRRNVRPPAGRLPSSRRFSSPLGPSSRSPGRPLRSSPRPRYGNKMSAKSQLKVKK